MFIISSFQIISSWHFTLLSLIFLAQYTSSFNHLPSTTTTSLPLSKNLKKYHHVKHHHQQQQQQQQQTRYHVISSSAAVDNMKTNQDEKITTTKPKLIPFQTASTELQNLIQSSDTTPISIIGYVSQIRPFGSSLLFFDLIHGKISNNDDAEKNSMIPSIQAMLRRQLYNSKKNTFDAYVKGTIVPGTKLCLTGVASPSRNPGEALVVVQNIKVVGVPRNPQHLRGLLSLIDVERFRIGEDKEINEGKCGLDMDEVAHAMDMETHDLLHLLTTTPSHPDDNKSAKKSIDYNSIAKQLLQATIPKDLNYPTHDQLEGKGKDSSLPPLTKELISPPSWIQQKLRRDKEQSDDENVNEGNNSPLSIQSILQQFNTSTNNLLLEKEQQRQEEVVVAGWVQNRRRFRNSVAVLEIVDDFKAISSLQDEDEDNDDNDDDMQQKEQSQIQMQRKDDKKKMTNIEKRNLSLQSDWKKRLKCILHPKSFTQSTETLDIYRNVCSPAARVLLQGYIVTPNDNDEKNNNANEDSGAITTTMWVTNAKLLRSTWRPSIIKYMLDLLHQSKFDLQEAADAFELDGGYQQAEGELLSLKKSTERQWKAVEICQKLQNANSRVGKVTVDMEQVLENFSGWRERYPMEFVLPEKHSTKETKDYDSNDDDDNVPSRWQRAKKPQLQWMIQQISNVVQSHPAYGERTIHILDVGGGKGHLANVIAESLGDRVSVHVVDVSSRTIKNGMMRSKRKLLENVRYSVNDASQVDFTNINMLDGYDDDNSGEAGEAAGIDVVVALHACGALSDVALGHAVMNGASFVVCPCCFRSNTHLRVMVPSDNYANEPGEVDDKSGDVSIGRTHSGSGSNSNINQKFATVAEWLDIEENELDSLRLLAELQGDFEFAGKAMHTLCALRAGAVAKFHNMNRRALSSQRVKDAGIDLDISIKTFPIGFSTRNLCIIGRLSAAKKFDGRRKEEMK